MNSKLRSSLFAATIVFGLFAVGCKKTIKKDSLEASIKSNMEKAGMKLKSVTCPAGREAKAGDAFECPGELEEGGPIVFAVKQKDDKGNMDLTYLGVAVKQTEVSEIVSKHMGGKSDAKCPKQVQVLRKGQNISCTFDGAAKGKVDIAPTDDEKDYKLKMTKEGAPAAEPELPAGHKEEAPTATTAEEE